MDDYGIEKPTPTTNRSAPHTQCKTCDGDRFVTVRLRSPETTLWMEEHNVRASTTSFHEEVAPCPDCNPIEIGWWRHNGTKFRVMDPAAVREAIRP